MRVKTLLFAATVAAVGVAFAPAAHAWQCPPGTEARHYNVSTVAVITYCAPVYQCDPGPCDPAVLR